MGRRGLPRIIGRAMTGVRLGHRLRLSIIHWAALERRWLNRNWLAGIVRLRRVLLAVIWVGNRLRRRLLVRLRLIVWLLISAVLRVLGIAGLLTITGLLLWISRLLLRL